jgi:hypothetical protein
MLFPLPPLAPAAGHGLEPFSFFVSEEMQMPSAIGRALVEFPRTMTLSALANA